MNSKEDDLIGKILSFLAISKTGNVYFFPLTTSAVYIGSNKDVLFKLIPHIFAKKIKQDKQPSPLGRN